MNLTEASEQAIRLLEEQKKVLRQEHDAQIASLDAAIANIREAHPREMKDMPVKPNEFAGMRPGDAIYKYLLARPHARVPIRTLTEALTSGHLGMLIKVKNGNGGRSVLKEQIRLVRITLGNNKRGIMVDEEEDTARLGSIEISPRRNRKSRKNKDTTIPPTPGAEGGDGDRRDVHQFAFVDNGEHSVCPRLPLEGDEQGERGRTGDGLELAAAGDEDFHENSNR